MRRVRRYVCLHLAAVALGAGVAEAQLNCGAINVRNDAYQVGNRLTVGVDANTSREIVFCPLEVQTEVWVEGYGGAGTNRGIYSSLLYISRPVPTEGPYQSKAKHWLIWYWGALWQQHDASTDETTVTIQAEEEEPPPTCDADYQYNPSSGECELMVSPIVADVLHDGFKLTSPEDGVLFDLDADGTPEQIAWTLRDSDDAWLAMDRNGNGRIDNGSELFGNFTPAYANEPTGPRAANGFLALRFTEGPSYGRSRADEVIDQNDAIFPRLLLWRDANHNGISEPGELAPTATLGLVSVETLYKESRKKDRHGNEFRQRAKSVWTDGEFFVYDVWLRRQ